MIDVLNRVQKEIGGTNPATQIVQYGYDNNGNRTTTTDPFSRVTTQVFDALNRVKEIRDPFNGVAAPTKFEYNRLDQLTKVRQVSSMRFSWRAP